MYKELEPEVIPWRLTDKEVFLPIGQGAKKLNTFASLASKAPADL